ncbi:MAG: leucyl/phenylalanyl-tRNA--protein transferase [Gammaproteobacteria bacterium]|nr:leucyl/phenylalanyl-tRNA--protein transferase [Gammaproteobacteria bacterium]
MLTLPYWIPRGAPPETFPDAELALREPNGLLAAGGDLSPQRLVAAYRRGIFPWYGDDQPILWWTPDPRTVLLPGTLRISRSLRKTLNRGIFEVTLDTAFEQVIAACAAPRGDDDGTWITREMFYAYNRLHRLGWAHSVECRQYGQLVGGLYGVGIGRVFFGESMFSRVSDASKVALVHLCRMNYELIDCQIESDHLFRLGAQTMPRAQFLRQLNMFAGDEAAAPPTGGQYP